MPERLLRTFVAASVPNQVAAIRDRLATTIDDRGILRWVRPNAIHLTLKFLGPTPADVLPRIDSGLERVARGFRPLELVVCGTGCFPNERRPRVLWLGLDGAVDELQEVVRSVHGLLAPLGFPDESTGFTPHITVARISYPRKTTPDVRPFLQSSYEAIPMSVDRLHLISSELLPGGPVYTRLGTHYFSPPLVKE